MDRSWIGFRARRGSDARPGVPTVRWVGVSTLCAVAACWASTASAEGVPRFTAPAPWNDDISAAPRHDDSESMISTLVGLGGFGFGRMQIDFSLHVVRAEQGAPTRTVVTHPDGYYTPDCDDLGSVVPVPAGAAIEGQAGLTCNHLSADCHLLVVQDRTLYELYQATASGGSAISARCLATWRLDLQYPEELRGEHCTSADAAGLPIAPLLWNADDVAASLADDPAGNGDLGHAIRFILPNDHMASEPGNGGVDGRLYVRPATHAGGPSGPAGSVPYGVRLRLRSDFPLAGYAPGPRVVLNTLKRYGMILADGGNIALTAESDLYTDNSWSSVGIDSRVFDLTSGATDVTAGDFEVVEHGPAHSRDLRVCADRSDRGVR